MKKREKGAAMVLALLVLMFFMAISLNVFFIAEKQAKKAGIRVVGNKAQSVIDTGANLGMYEVRTAFRYMRGNMNSAVTDMAANQGGIDFTNGAEVVESVRAGANYIRTSQFHEYFTSFETSWAAYPSVATTDSSFRTSTTPSAVAKIWSTSNTDRRVLSIGGYQVESGNTDVIAAQFRDSPAGPPENMIEEFQTTATAVNVIMLKRLRTLSSGSAIRSGFNRVNQMNFQIRYYANATLTGTGIRKTILREDATDIIVINADN